MRTTTLIVGTLVAALAGAPAHAGGTIKGKLTAAKVRQAAGSVAYLEKVDGKFPPKNAVMDQQGSTFVPRVLPVLAGSSVTFRNSDPTDHNVYSPDNEGYDLGTKPKGGELTRAFPSAGVYTQLCKLHPTMIGFVVVLQNPYHAVAGEDGSFTIENVPAGKHRLLVWNERLEADAVDVDVKEGQTAEVSIELRR